MAPDTTRLGSDLIVASLQRELAEARAVMADAHAALSSFTYDDEQGDWAGGPHVDVMDSLLKRLSAPGPSDAKGEGQTTSDTKVEGKRITSDIKLIPLTDPTVRGVLVDDGEPTHKLTIFGLHINLVTGRVFQAREQFCDNKCQPVKLRPASEFGVAAEPTQKLVPLPEGAVPVVRCCVTDADFYNQSSQPLMPSGFYKAIDPALYGVPAERVRELERWLTQTRKQRDGFSHQMTRAMSEAERLRKAIEEVLALPFTTIDGIAALILPVTVRDKLQAALTPPTATPQVSASGEKDIGPPPDNSDDWVFSMHRRKWVKKDTYPASAPAARTDAERLRKAIEEALACINRQGAPIPFSWISEAAHGLQAALIPPTAASGEKITLLPTEHYYRKAMEVSAEIKGHSKHPSAPAAESEGGEGIYDRIPREVTAEPTREEWFADWPEEVAAVNRLAMQRQYLAYERDALSARLAACEERCKELEEAGREAVHHLAVPLRKKLVSLLAPKAEGSSQKYGG